MGDTAKDIEKSIANNTLKVRERIHNAARRAGREPYLVRLLAATKTRSVEQIREALAAGVDFIGENRAQEMEKKYREIGNVAQWHFIGHLQRNKARLVVGIASLIHSVDSVRIAEKIDEEAKRAGKIQKVLLQVNVSGEETKFGFTLDDVHEFLEHSCELSNLDIVGLSTLAPEVNDPEEVRWVFRDLRILGEKLNEEFRTFRLEELSMGMTKDFEVAVEEGATIVRVGSAIFECG